MRYRNAGRHLRLAAMATLALLARPAAAPPPGAEPLSATPTPAAPSETPSTASGFDRMGDGFVVWETRRTGPWRIWIRPLDGTPARQLSPDEAGHQHFCPHISPDGAWVAYLSLEAGRDAYPQLDPGVLHRVRTDGSADEILARSARAYGGNRAAVWHGSDRIQYIDGQGRSLVLDLAGHNQSVLATSGGWLVNRTRTHATTGTPTFSIYRRDTRTVAEQRSLGGCEPYFSDDGAWGFWVAGGGGPIARIDLATREVSTILAKNDPRLPADRGYIYFPMLARSGLLLAWGASDGSHDHNRADYDIFVAQTDPRTLELLGPPVRYTSDRGCDRYPDVYLAPLPLGRHFGEAPFTVRFDRAEFPGPWRWDWGDGTVEITRTATHTYDTAGAFAIHARQGKRRPKGQVIVAPATPPRPVSATLVGERQLAVAFDEPVDLTAVSASFDSGRVITARRPGDDGRSLRLTLAEPVSAPDRLNLAGVTDRAQVPNPMPPATLDIAPPRWPSDRRGLAFLWERADRPNLVLDRGDGSQRTYPVEGHGLAVIDHDQAMRLAGGVFAAGPEAGWNLVAACKGSNALTLELVLSPAALDPPGPWLPVVALSDGPDKRNLVLAQVGTELRLALRTATSSARTAVSLARLSSTDRVHLVVTYEPGRLVAYLDGQPVLASDELTDGFFHWRPRQLQFGQERGWPGAWQGTLEGVALYDRVLPPKEVAENHRRYQAAIAERPAVPRFELRAALDARSASPTLDEIAPYRQGLVVFEYTVLERLAGSPPGGPKPGDRVRVVHWSILDGQVLAVNGRALGSPARLSLEPFAQNPQLASLYIADRLPADFDLPLYYDVPGGW